MASIAYFLVTIATLLFVTTTPPVSSFSGTSPFCVPPGEDGLFNLACSGDRDLPDVGQQAVLNFIGNNTFRKINADLCADVTVSGTTYYVFGGCNNDFTTEACKNCVPAARSVIIDHCPNGVGAQAAATNCCVRYETYKFCEDS
ncbi:unnamed protein product [Linum trigynum]|uniref:Gnk2-homologous domain-containing protein n=1 Tax=Linum trigynum TaxID=586398 RepID=A0AAV2GH45_9ROSI